MKKNKNKSYPTKFTGQICESIKKKIVPVITSDLSNETFKQELKRKLNDYFEKDFFKQASLQSLKKLKCSLELSFGILEAETKLDNEIDFVQPTFSKSIKHEKQLRSL